MWYAWHLAADVTFPAFSQRHHRQRGRGQNAHPRSEDRFLQLRFGIKKLADRQNLHKDSLAPSHSAYFCNIGAKYQNMARRFMSQEILQMAARSVPVS